MEEKEDVDAFETLWRNIEPFIIKVSGEAEIRVLRYAVKLGFEAGRQETLKNLYRFLRVSSEIEFKSKQVELEPA